MPDGLRPLSEREFRWLQPLLGRRGGQVQFPYSVLKIDVDWSRRFCGHGCEFMLCRGNLPLLVGGCAQEANEARWLWKWLSFLYQTTFEQPAAPVVVQPPDAPWVGAVMMPGGLALPWLDGERVRLLAWMLAQALVRSRNDRAGDLPIPDC